MPPSEYLANCRSEVLEIMSRYAPQGISNLRVIGSVARGTDGPDSDIDFLVDAGQISLMILGGLQSELEELLKVPVHILVSDSIKAELRDRIFAEAVEI